MKGRYVKRIATCLLCFIATACASTLVAVSHECIRHYPVCKRLYAVGAQLVGYLPEGRRPSTHVLSVYGPGHNPESMLKGRTDVEISGIDVLWYLLMNRAMPGVVGWFLYHMLVCGIVLFCYRWKALPEAIRSLVGSRVVVAGAWTRGAAISAWLSIAWFPLVLVLHRVLWGAFLARFMGPSPVVLAVGPLGVGLMYCGAALAHLAVVVWAVRREIRKVVRGLPDIHCSKCGYELTGAAGPTCPECGSRDAPRRPLTTFGLSRLSIRLQCTPWRHAFAPAVALVTLSLYMAPVLLPLIGRILPTPVLEFIGKVYYTLF